MGQIAFNLMAWFKRMVLPEPYQQSTIKTIRHQVLNVAARSSRREGSSIWCSQINCYQEVWEEACTRIASKIAKDIQH